MVFYSIIFSKLLKGLDCFLFCFVRDPRLVQLCGVTFEKRVSATKGKKKSQKKDNVETKKTKQDDIDTKKSANILILSNV